MKRNRDFCVTRIRPLAAYKVKLNLETSSCYKVFPPCLDDLKMPIRDILVNKLAAIYSLLLFPGAHVVRTTPPLSPVWRMWARLAQCLFYTHIFASLLVNSPGRHGVPVIYPSLPLPSSALY